MVFSYPLEVLTLSFGGGDTHMSGKEISSDSVEVNIFNKIYVLRSGSDVEHLRRIAKLVDERMHQIASQRTTHDVAKIAVLAALNIADEMQSLVDLYEKEFQALRPQSAAAAGATEQTRENEETTHPMGDEQQQQSWFEAIFDSDAPAAVNRERLSSQISARLHALRQTRQESLAAEIEEDAN